MAYLGSSSSALPFAVLQHWPESWSSPSWRNVVLWDRPVKRLPIHWVSQLTVGSVCVRMLGGTWNPEVLHLLFAWELQGAGLWPWFPWQWATSFCGLLFSGPADSHGAGALGQRQRMERGHRQTL